jgi:hypothetical protein
VRSLRDSFHTDAVYEYVNTAVGSWPMADRCRPTLTDRRDFKHAAQAPTSILRNEWGLFHGNGRYDEWPL